jgi:hypothetical protein
VYKQIPFGNDRQRGKANDKGKGKSRGNDKGKGKGNDWLGFVFPTLAGTTSTRRGWGTPDCLGWWGRQKRVFRFAQDDNWLSWLNRKARSYPGLFVCS